MAEKTVVDKIKARRKAEADALKAMDSAQAVMPKAQEAGIDYDASLHKKTISYEQAKKSAAELLKKMGDEKKSLEEAEEWDPVTKTWKKKGA